MTDYKIQVKIANTDVSVPKECAADKVLDVQGPLRLKWLGIHIGCEERLGEEAQKGPT